MARFTMRTVATLYVAALILLVVLADQGGLPTWANRVHEQPFGDDLAHMMLALGLTVALDLALGRRRWRSVRIGPVLAFLALTGEELSQHLLPERVLSPLDMAATWIGVLLGAWLANPGGWLLEHDQRENSNGSSSPTGSSTLKIG